MLETHLTRKRNNKKTMSDLRFDFTKIKPITNFKDSAAFQFMKCTQKQERTDEDLAIMSLSLHKSDITGHFIFIEDAYTFSHTQEMGVGSKNVKYDGIYDIWLKDCVNVSSVSIVFECAGPEISIESIKSGQETIQIPLAFQADSVKHVTHYYSDLNGVRRNVSFIPTLALYATQHMRIKLNEGASATVCLSTVYAPKLYRQSLVNAYNIFYVDGKPFVTMHGKVVPYSNDVFSCSCVIS